MGAGPSKRIIVQLRIGAAGYAVGVVAWSLFWLAFAWNYVSMWAGSLGYAAFFAVSISFIMVGVGCFGLDTLYGSRLAVLTGVAHVITAVPSVVMGLLNLPPFAPRALYLWPYGYLALLGNGLLTASVFCWTLSAFELARSAFRRLCIAIGAASLASAILFLLLLPRLGWISFGFTPVTQPYVVAQVLSAVLLHKIGSDVQRTSRGSEQA